MKILYGVQATGNGHITRARAMAREFQKLPVEVDFLFSGRDPEAFFEMEVFGDYRVLKGLTFAIGDGKILPMKTLLQSRPLGLLQEIRQLDVDSYDLIITDFEPVTAWAGRLRKKAVIGIAHQYAFLYPVPQHRSDPFQRAILRYFAPANTSLGIHWHHFGQPILPPIAPVDTAPCELWRNHYIIYLPFESRASIRKLLNPFSHYQFHIYHPDAEPGDEGHLSWHRPGRQSFQQDLQHCEGVICNAGFELASEVLQLGRKLLVKPVAGQSEQYSNAMAIDLLGYGHVMNRLDPGKVSEWLQSACATRIHFPNVAAAVCEWLVAGTHDDIQALSTRLWNETLLPDMTAATRTDYQLSLAPAVSALQPPPAGALLR